MYSEMIKFGKRIIEEGNYVKEIDIFSFEGLYKKLIIFVAEKSVSLFLRQNQGIVLEGSKDTVLKSISNIVDFYESVVFLTLFWNVNIIHFIYVIGRIQNKRFWKEILRFLIL